LIESLDFFHTSSEFNVPVRGYPLNIAIKFGTEKPEWPGYPTVKKV